MRKKNQRLTFLKNNQCVLIKFYTKVSALHFLLYPQLPDSHKQNRQRCARPSNSNVQALLISIALLLAFVIWGLSRVVTLLARKTLDKSKKAAKALTPLLLLVFSLSGFQSYAQEAVVETGKVAPNYYGLSPFDFWILVAVIAAEMVVIAFLLFMVKRFEKELLPQKRKKAKSFTVAAWWKRADEKLFTKAVPVEREADILLEHDYDGIQELDNSLPPWWKYGFYVTIGVAVIYLLNFHVLGYGKNPTEEYDQEMAKAKIEMEAYAAKSGNKLDENNIQMPDAAGLARGKEIYTTSCWPCHGKLGEGGAGPNLTDDYWLHKGSLTDIYNSIKHGYPEKGMQAWEKNFSAKEISYIAGYIKTLKGTNPPNAKAPQGDLYNDETVADATSSK